MGWYDLKNGEVNLHLSPDEAKGLLALALEGADALLRNRLHGTDEKKIEAATRACDNLAFAVNQLEKGGY